MKLTTSAINGNLKAGRYSDGRNLYLLVSATGAKSWLFIYRAANGKQRELGLGSFTGAGSAFAVNLADARLAADKARLQLAAGIDPVEAKIAVKRAALAASVTFAELLDEVIKREKGDGTKRSDWKVVNGVCEQEDQWRASLANHAGRLLTKRVAEIGDDDIIKVLSPIWSTIHVTAERIRVRIATVLDLAIARRLHAGPNPARFDAHIEQLLGKRDTASKRKQPSLPFAELPAVFRKITGPRAGMAAKALAFTILTAVRTDAARGARWSEIDLAARTWIVPAERNKSDNGDQEAGAHIVPLSDAAIAVLESCPRSALSDFVFFGISGDKPVNEGALRDKLIDAPAKGGLGLAGRASTHGMRATFRTWVSARKLDEKAAELALGHVIGNKVQRAYDRDEMIEARRALLQAWGEYATSSNVIELRAAA